MKRNNELDTLNKLVAELIGRVAILEANNKASVPLETKIVGNLKWHTANKPMDWADAKEYASGLGVGWRLPTVQELVSLWDYDKGCCEAFPDDNGWFWSSSPYDNIYAWYVSFDSGLVDSSNRYNGLGVRCVRNIE